MTRLFRQVLPLFAMVVLSVAASSQAARTVSAQRSGTVSCYVLPAQNSSPLQSRHSLELCHGVVVLDYIGEALVNLPDGFDSQAGDLRYQLTPIGKPSPNLHVADEVSGNRFRIAGGRMKQKISWQVIGSRTDMNTSALDTALPTSSRR